MAVGLWDSSFKNAFHTLSYRFAAIILVILYSRGKGKELKDAEQGCIADTLTFFDPADAVSDPKMVRIWGNPTRFSLFFLTPQMQFLTLKRYVFWEIQLAFPCFLSEKRAKESSLFVNKSKYTSNQETTFGLAAGDFAIAIH